jgi:hypothetical protein
MSEVGPDLQVGMEKSYQGYSPFLLSSLKGYVSPSDLPAACLSGDWDGNLDIFVMLMFFYNSEACGTDFVLK